MITWINIYYNLNLKVFKMAFGYSNCYEKSLNGKIDHTAKHSILYHKHLHEHSQLGTGCRGASGNACHIECSNRGKCDNTKGSCECYPGFFGEACENYDVLNAGRL